jgi:hypothetical protein
MPSETEEDYLTRCVVDTLARKFYLYSSDGNKLVVECDNVNDFMSRLEFVRSMLDEKTLVYCDL